MWFSQLDSSEDFMARDGLRFSLSLIVSELWRHQWRNFQVCESCRTAMQIAPPAVNHCSVAASLILCSCMCSFVVSFVSVKLQHWGKLSTCDVYSSSMPVLACVLCLINATGSLCSIIYSAVLRGRLLLVIVHYCHVYAWQRNMY